MPSLFQYIGSSTGSGSDRYFHSKKRTSIGSKLQSTTRESAINSPLKIWLNTVRGFSGCFDGIVFTPLIDRSFKANRIRTLIYGLTGQKTWFDQPGAREVDEYGVASEMRVKQPGGISERKRRQHGRAVMDAQMHAQELKEDGTFGVHANICQKIIDNIPCRFCFPCPSWAGIFLVAVISLGGAIRHGCQTQAARPVG